MIRLHFDLLRFQKEERERRKLTLRRIAAETGLSVDTLQRLRKGPQAAGRVTYATLDTLCRYFELDDIGQLLEYIRPADQVDTEAKGPASAVSSQTGPCWRPFRSSSENC